MNAARSKHMMRLASSSEQGEADTSGGGRFASAEGSGSHIEDSCASSSRNTVRLTSCVETREASNRADSDFKYFVYRACCVFAGSRTIFATHLSYQRAHDERHTGFVKGEQTQPSGLIVVSDLILWQLVYTRFQVHVASA
jgi:hypothetical protein